MSTFENEGQRLLYNATRDRGKAADVAKRVAVTQSSISRWCSGKRIPDAIYRVRLNKVLKIPFSAWDNGPKRG